MQADILKIDVYYSPKCKSYSQMISLLERALQELGLKAQINTHLIRSKEEAQQIQFLGSSTVKINGEDLEPGAKGSVHLA